MTTFEVINPITGEPESTVKNDQPRQAARKAVNCLRREEKDFSKIVLREKGTTGNGQAAVIHVFTGTCVTKKAGLPVATFIKQGIEKKAGKPIPTELNVKGKEAELEKAGFVLPMIPDPNVRKVGKFHVPKVEGKDVAGAIVEFVKSLGAQGAKTPKAAKA